MTEAELRCPVCEAPFGNAGALATHQQLTKDAAHVAGRAQGDPGETGALVALGEATPASPPASPSPPARLASPQASHPEAASGEAGEATPPSRPGEAKQGEATFALALPPPQARPEMELLALPPPASVEPLLPPPDKAHPGEPSKATAVVVPLEPIFAGMATAALNGLVLNKPTDGELTLDMVRATGFPQAAEACLRLYFPDLPLDHPLAALIGSGASLAVLVVSLKGKAGKTRAQAPEGDGEASPGKAEAPAAKPGATTGDPYWDRILASAGGVQA
jgi:hypothetical protein